MVSVTNWIVRPEVERGVCAAIVCESDLPGQGGRKLSPLLVLDLPRTQGPRVELATYVFRDQGRWGGLSSLMHPVQLMKPKGQWCAGCGTVHHNVEIETRCPRGRANPEGEE